MKSPLGEADGGGADAFYNFERTTSSPALLSSSLTAEVPRLGLAMILRPKSSV
jgi:hypothetical protein